jgi:transcription elongation factor Elf1
MSPYLNFNCPYCDHKYTDELEVLDEDVLHDFKCENCDKPFRMLIAECEACSKDTTFVWRETPDSETLSSLQCSHCGKPVHPVDEPEQED